VYSHSPVASSESFEIFGAHPDGTAHPQVGKLAAVAEAVDGRRVDAEPAGDFPDRQQRPWLRTQGPETTLACSLDQGWTKCLGKWR
jgi:hypothetical protein